MTFVAGGRDATGVALAGGLTAHAGAAAGRGKPAATENEAVAAADEAVVIQVSGLEPGSLARLAAMPGILSVRPDTADEANGAARVTAQAAASDEVLRQLLKLDGVHVHAVRAEASREAGQ